MRTGLTVFRIERNLVEAKTAMNSAMSRTERILHFLPLNCLHDPRLGGPREFTDRMGFQLGYRCHSTTTSKAFWPCDLLDRRFSTFPSSKHAEQHARTVTEAKIVIVLFLNFLLASCRSSKSPSSPSPPHRTSAATSQHISVYPLL